MESILTKSNNKIHRVSLRFQRSLLNNANFSYRLIAIKGARGSGKTTLLLQFAKKFLPTNNQTLYVAMDDLYFEGTTLYDLASEFVKNNGKHLLLDEVHKYPGWAQSIKLIYDDFPELQVIFTSSSILDIYNAEADLSRRLVKYSLPELSLREYIAFGSEIHLPVYSLEELLNNHQEIAIQLNDQIKPIYEFNNYLQHGQYPYFIEGIEQYYSKLMATINLILEIDLSAIENIDYNNIVKLKQLLSAISSSAPFIPNVSKLSEKIGLSRPFLIKAFKILEKAQLIILAHKSRKGISQLSKPDKIFIRNTNLIFAIANNKAERGNVRETFFINQTAQNYEVNLHDKADFIINDKYIFEVGGRNKTSKQISGFKDAFTVKDDIENGVHNTIPLWLFGFLY